ncbi:MAG: serine hydrolase domain-containing protein, partial [Burkholderiaceae bacterium]|nr:serine hydrolase domain-containing protein [Burkholderiaceae bacterium]
MFFVLRTATVVSALLGWCTAAVANTPPATQVAEQAGRVMQDIAQHAHFNGAVVLMRDGQVIFEQAIGLAQRKPDRPFTVDTTSDGASLAKTLTAALVHEMAAEGRLNLDDPVTRHLPAYPYAKHTLRDLVSHRTGLPDYGAFDADFKPDQVRDTADLLAVLVKRKPAPALAPGVQVEYANLGFDLAALVVERVTGQKITSLWQERYFKRLGMQGTFARPARFADWPVPRTPGYQ